MYTTKNLYQAWQTSWNVLVSNFSRNCRLAWKPTIPDLVHGNVSATTNIDDAENAAHFCWTILSVARLTRTSEFPSMAPATPPSPQPFSTGRFLPRKEDQRESSSCACLQRLRFTFELVCLYQGVVFYDSLPCTSISVPVLYLRSVHCEQSEGFTWLVTDIVVHDCTTM